MLRYNSLEEFYGEGKSKKGKPKYRNNKTRYNGKTYDSSLEANRYAELKLLERAGKISDLQTQVEFVLIPTQRIDGKVVERKCSYIADFVYINENGDKVVEDTKGVRTTDYIIKRKLMLQVYGIRISEINRR